MSYSEPLLQEPEQDQWADLLLFLLRNNCSPNDQTKNAHANPSGGPDLYCPTQQPRATSQQSTLNGIIWRVKPQLVMPVSYISVLLQMHGSSASDPVPCKWAWESNRRWSECSGPYYPWQNHKECQASAFTLSQPLSLRPLEEKMSGWNIWLSLPFTVPFKYRRYSHKQKYNRLKRHALLVKYRLGLLKFGQKKNLKCPMIFLNVSVTCWTMVQIWLN